MSRLCVRQLDSVRQLRDLAGAWDQLWQKSEVAMPTARAELVALWVEHFAPRAAFRVVLVEQDGQPAAALPLVGGRFRRVVPVGDLTWNSWSPNGELLLDPDADVNAVAERLAAELDRLPWPLFCFGLVPLESVHWQAFIRSMASRGLAIDTRVQYRIGQVEISGDYPRYEAGRSKHFRRQLGKDLRRLKREGPVQLRTDWNLAPDEVEPRLREAMEVDRRSWKNERGSSILATPGMFEFYHRQACELARCGHLRLTLLEHQGAPIAFEMGWAAKEVYHSFKVGYDQAYRRFSPGHVLRKHLIERLFGESEYLMVDFQGPMNQALSSWSTRSYPIARLVVAPRKPGSRALFAGYKTVAPIVRRLRAISTGARV